MASAWSEEEAFTCSVCLETLKEPATLPCGHSYCLVCIQSHWDKKDGDGQHSCPQCRQVFRPRPSLAKSTVLVEAMEKLRANSLKLSASSAASPSVPIYLEVLPDAGPHQGGVYPQLPVPEPRPCPQHGHPLDQFCREDKECVCKECCQQEHKGHGVVTPQEEREERQEELTQMQADVQRRMQEAERDLNQIPHFARQHKALVQALQQENADSFAELAKNVAVMGARVSELLSSHEASLGSRVEGRINSLEQEVARLRWRSADLSRLADMKDPVCFLKNFLTMDPLGQREAAPPEEEAAVASIRAATKDLQQSVQELCKANLEKISSALNQGSVTAPTSDGAAAAAGEGEGVEAADGNGPLRSQSTVYEMVRPLPPPRPVGHDQSPKSSPCGSIQEASAPPPPLPQPQPQARPAATADPANPEPKTRGEMLKFRFEPTMDPNSAYRHLQLSDGGRKATLKAENLNPPEHPERFHFWRQVLCREPLGGSPYYWEVEWTGHKVTVGVAYREMQRKSSDEQSRLGHNALSWSLYWSGSGFSFWHNGEEKLLGSPKARRIGVYLDQHAGVLSFYRISNSQAHLIHRHRSPFSGPLYPGFRFWSAVGEAVTICQLD